MRGRRAVPERLAEALSDDDAGRGKLRAQLADLAGDLLVQAGVGGRAHDRVHPRGDLAHLGFLHAAAGDAGGAEADAARVERLARVERDGVVVELDAGGVERLRGDLAGDVLGREVGEDEVVVGAAGDEVEAALEQRLGERARVGDDLARVVAEGRLDRKSVV